MKNTMLKYFLYGSKDWISRQAGREAMKERSCGYWETQCEVLTEIKTQRLDLSGNLTRWSLVLGKRVCFFKEPVWYYLCKNHIHKKLHSTNYCQSRLVLFNQFIRRTWGSTAWVTGISIKLSERSFAGLTDSHLCLLAVDDSRWSSQQAL